MYCGGGNAGPLDFGASAALGFLAPTAGGAGDLAGTTGASSAAAAGAFFLAGASAFFSAFGASAFFSAFGASPFFSSFFSSFLGSSAFFSSFLAAGLSSPRSYIALASPINAMTAKVKIIFFINNNIII